MEINYRRQHNKINDYFVDDKRFILQDDPLFAYHPQFLPFKCCPSCNHQKYYILYTYKEWNTAATRLSNFASVHCDRCGEFITWTNKYLRDALIEKNQLNVWEID